MASNQIYWLTKLATLSSHLVTQSFLDEYGPIYLPLQEGQTEATEVTAGSIPLDQAYALAVQAGKIRSTPAFTIERVDGSAPIRDSQTPTHRVVPMRNVGGNITLDAIAIAQAEGTPLQEAMLSHKQILQYLQTGKLPS